VGKIGCNLLGFFKFKRVEKRKMNRQKNEEY
jgi:hypothetical protein